MTQTQTNTENSFSIELLKQLAFMQHEGESYFIVDGKAYIGDEDAARESYEAAKEDFESFEHFCSDECDEVEEFDNDDYWVLTDEEADEKWEESLDSYIEECITPEIDKLSEGAGNLSYYITFDEDMWKRDARMDGRGHSLSSYDGHEYEETVQGQTFYIYRLN